MTAASRPAKLRLLGTDELFGRFIWTIAEASSTLRKAAGSRFPGSPVSSSQRLFAWGEALSPEAQLASKGRGWSPLRIDSGSSRVLPRAPARHTKDGFLAVPRLGLPRAHLPATLNMALTRSCIPVEPSPDSSREVWRVPPPPPPHPLPAPPPPPAIAPALPRAAATATAAGAAPPPCQLLSCNGDWAAAAEVTPRAGKPGWTCACEDCGEPQLGRGLAAGERRPPLRLSFLPCLPPGGSQEPGRGGHPVRPRSGEARPGSPGAGQGGVTAPSARPRGMHRGSRGRRRHSQVSCGKTWRSLRTFAPPRLPLSAVPGPPRWPERRGGAPWHCLASSWGTSLGSETSPGGSS